MEIPTIIRTHHGYWLLLPGANHLPTMDPAELAGRIEALTNRPARFVCLVSTTDFERQDFELSLEEERQTLRALWQDAVREAEFHKLEWWEAA